MALHKVVVKSSQEMVVYLKKTFRSLTDPNCLLILVTKKTLILWHYSIHLNVRLETQLATTSCVALRRSNRATRQPQKPNEYVLPS